MKSLVSKSDILTVSRETWLSIFSGKSHLDSALSRIKNPSLKDSVAKILPMLMRNPYSVAHQFGLAQLGNSVWRQSPIEWADHPEWPRLVEKMSTQLTQTGSLVEPEVSPNDFPPEMLSYWRSTFGESTANRLVKELGRSPGLTVRFRSTGSSNSDEWVRRVFKETGVEFKSGSLAPYSLSASRYCRIFGTSEYERGDFEVQDEGSQLLALLALSPAEFAEGRWVSDLPGGEIDPISHEFAKVSPLTFIDACAGAGGKTLAVADAMAGRGRVFAYDVSQRKLKALSARVSRTQMRNVKTLLLREAGEAEQLKDHFKSADRVLVDAPCSGWGVLRRNPDIKWLNRERNAFGHIETLQRRLLSTYSALVKDGGFLTFSTCTFRREETTEVVTDFLRANPEFHLVFSGFLGPGSRSEGGMDGFFAAGFKRSKV